MYCTNQLEPVPGKPGAFRLVWQQMKVGCVYWQDADGTWNKKMIWGRESPREFGAALFRLACRCGYREAAVKVFAADGGAWCWDIRNEYFSEACGILDWFHASEHIWEAARQCADQDTDAKSWANAALDQMHASGGAGLVAWLREQSGRRRGKAREAIKQLLAYVEPRADLMKYPQYRARGLQNRHRHDGIYLQAVGRTAPQRAGHALDRSWSDCRYGPACHRSQPKLAPILGYSDLGHLSLPPITGCTLGMVANLIAIRAAARI